MPDLYHIDTEEQHIGQVETEHNGTPYDVRYFSSIADLAGLHERYIIITAVVNCNTMEHIDPTCATARTIIRGAMSSILKEEKEAIDAIGEIDDL